MSPTDFKLVADMDLKAVLTEMKALGAKGELLVVTHSNPHGLKMPVVAGGNAAAAEMKIMNTLVHISSGEVRGVKRFDPYRPTKSPRLGRIGSKISIPISNSMTASKETLVGRRP